MANVYPPVGYICKKGKEVNGDDDEPLGRTLDKMVTEINLR